MIQNNSLKNLKDQDLLNTLISKAQNERNLTLEIIELLEEVDQRKLFLEKGYGSLLEFCVKELKYSESAAYRRISAMRVVRDVPEVKTSISKGTLNLVNIAQAQTFINQERKYNNKTYSKSEKKDLILDLENKSKRECEKILISKSPNLPKPEIIKPITSEKTQITLTLDQSLIQKLENLKFMYSHINPNATYAELIELMADKLLNKKNLNKPKSFSLSGVDIECGALIPTEPKIESDTTFKKETRPDLQVLKDSKILSQKRSPPAAPPGQKVTRYIPAPIKKQVYLRDHGCCSFEDPRTKKRCGSKFQLQFDHKYPYSLSGEHSLENLRLVCRSHNQFYANRTVPQKWR